jgi:hypothetical protein
MCQRASNVKVEEALLETVALTGSFSFSHAYGIIVWDLVCQAENGSME